MTTPVKPGLGSLQTKTLPNGTIEKTTPSGQVREKTMRAAEGERTQQFTASGRMQTEVLKKTDGSRQVTQFASNGKVQRTEVSKTDGSKETTSTRYGRNGRERSAETIKVDSRGREVSKTVVVKQTTVISRNTTIVNNSVIVKNYDHGRYGFVYHPVLTVSSPVLVSFYDPYWYSPVGVFVPHPFHYAWGWNDYAWYGLHHDYWTAYDVYPTPSYWMTDWLIAGYVADRYAASISAAQAREEARLAREEAAQARENAQRASEEAEIAEARTAQEEAELRASLAEARAAKAEAQEKQAEASHASANTAAIDSQTKEALRTQIEQTVLEKKQYAEEMAKGGNPVAPDLSKALADPKHIYPVSGPISVMSAVDQTPAGTLSEGDLLRLEPGQDNVLRGATENTFVTVRVLSAKGEEGEPKAGTLVSLPLKSLQDFDSEFRAKLDFGLAEADQNKELFKTGAL